MKTTIATLIALSGVSVGATLAEIDTSDTSLKAYWNFESSITLSAGSMKDSEWKNSPTWNSDGYGEMATTATHLYTTSAGLSAATGFTISFDINAASAGTLLSIGTQNGLNQPWRACSIILGAGAEEGTSLISAQFLGNTAGAIKKELNVSDSDWTTLTLVTTANSSKTLTLEFYINGDFIGSSSTENASNFVNETAKIVAFGNFTNSAIKDGGAPTNIDNILVYNRALTSDEVRALTIPEPTTATLSLLALAGLAARRRRK
ncbi:MAG: PEP-CTERM sorting domain-containing protein [Akkermansia sp.]|nr:PEP-CTERM sorting domain-containing protein [Akkermansia sp.]